MRAPSAAKGRQHRDVPRGCGRCDGDFVQPGFNTYNATSPLQDMQGASPDPQGNLKAHRGGGHTVVQLPRERVLEVCLGVEEPASGGEGGEGGEDLVHVTPEETVAPFPRVGHLPPGLSRGVR